VPSTEQAHLAYVPFWAIFEPITENAGPMRYSQSENRSKSQEKDQPAKLNVKLALVLVPRSVLKYGGPFATESKLPWSVNHVPLYLIPELLAASTITHRLSFDMSSALSSRLTSSSG